MKQPNIIIYGSHTCPDTQRATAFLDAREAPYEFKDLDAQPELNEYIEGLNGGKRVMPTIQIDNEVFFNPGDTKLSECLAIAEGAR